jgi:hypothetical protein
MFQEAMRNCMKNPWCKSRLEHDLPRSGIMLDGLAHDLTRKSRLAFFVIMPRLKQARKKRPTPAKVGRFA